MSSDAALWVANLAYGRLLGPVLPRAWFGPPVPARDALAPATGRPRLEIVAHCWRYAHMLRFQLASIAAHPPTKLDLVYTLYRAPAADDPGTESLLARYPAAAAPPNVTWRWRTLEPARLLRRAIGRNEAALGSDADRLWFTDCDVLFGDGCLDSLAAVARASNAPLLHPERESVTPLLDASHPLLTGPEDADALAAALAADPSLVEERTLSKATGPHQIVHGDVARAVGYCPDIGAYQRPTDRWRKTYEDVAFRRLLGTDGEAAPIGPVLRLRHRDKGRYGEGVRAGAVRGAVRRLRERIR